MEDVLIFNLEKCVHRQITATLAAFAAVTGSSKPATDTYPHIKSAPLCGSAPTATSGQPKTIHFVRWRPRRSYRLPI